MKKAMGDAAEYLMWLQGARGCLAMPNFYSAEGKFIDRLYPACPPAL
jgi:hypothetical protein